MVVMRSVMKIKIALHHGVKQEHFTAKDAKVRKGSFQYPLEG